MEEFRFIDHELWCEDVKLQDVAQRHGTPLYVYSQRSILDHCRWIERAFGSVEHLSCYALKANGNRAILRLLAREGIGADAGSIGEMHLALEAGFPAEKITFSGVGKRDDEIEFALQNNILALNVESEEEIGIINCIASRQRAEARIFLRVNFDIHADTHPYVSTGSKFDKFGVECSDAAGILSRAGNCSNVRFLGIHSHIGSQITKIETFLDAAKAIVRLADELKAAGMPVGQVNFGGGFGVQYRDYVRHPWLPADHDHHEAGITTVGMLETVLPLLCRTESRLLIQPGRSIVAHSGILLTKVLFRKNSSRKRFVIIDAGMNDLIRPSLYQSYHQIVPLHLQMRERERADVVGPLCESGDFFAIDRELPVVQRGDYLGVLCAGAYGYVLSSNYNGRPRAAEVMVDGSNVTVITPRETIDRL